MFYSPLPVTIFNSVAVILKKKCHSCCRPRIQITRNCDFSWIIWKVGLSKNIIHKDCSLHALIFPKKNLYRLYIIMFFYKKKSPTNYCSYLITHCCNFIYFAWFIILKRRIVIFFTAHVKYCYTLYSDSNLPIYHTNLPCSIALYI